MSETQQEQRRRERNEAAARAAAEGEAELRRRQQRAEEWRLETWGSESHPCSICGSSEWEFLELVDLNIPPVSGRSLMVYPLLPIICRNCGHVIFVSAVAAGIIDPDSTLDDGEDA